jgi:putative addiction module CopG family antidote
MKVSISLSDDDLAFIDEQTAAGIYASRSAAMAAGIRRLRELASLPQYLEDFLEWENSGEAALWETAVADGLDDEEWPEYATPASDSGTPARSATGADRAGGTGSGGRRGTGQDSTGRRSQQ